MTKNLNYLFLATAVVFGISWFYTKDGTWLALAAVFIALSGGVSYSGPKDKDKLDDKK